MRSAPRRAFLTNVDLEFQRNRERYQFLRWGQRAFDNFRVVPPDTGIVHQVNLEYLARVVFSSDENPQARRRAAPGLSRHPGRHRLAHHHDQRPGRAGLGRGRDRGRGRHAGPARLHADPEVVGFKLDGRLPEGATATDLVLTVTQMLRRKGVVGKFVEFYGPGLAAWPGRPGHHRQHGARVRRHLRFFPVDDETLQLPAVHRPLRGAGRAGRGLHARSRGSSTPPDRPSRCSPTRSSSTWRRSSPAWPGRRPQDRSRSREAKRSFRDALPSLLQPAAAGRAKRRRRSARSEGAAAIGGVGARARRSRRPPHAVMLEDAAEDARPRLGGHRRHHQLHQHLESLGDAGRRARWPRRRSSAGSERQAVGQDVAGAGLEGGHATTTTAPASTPYLDQLGFNLVGYGCTTCIGNTGPLPDGDRRGDRAAATWWPCSVLSGNRNFEGRINSDVRANYLMSPPLVVAFALAGTHGHRPARGAAGQRAPDGQPVFLRDIWPSSAEIEDTIASRRSSPRCTAGATATCSRATSAGTRSTVPEGDRFDWDPTLHLRAAAALLRRHADGEPAPVDDITGRARAGGAGRQRHHRPHLARRQHQEGLARRGSI